MAREFASGKQLKVRARREDGGVLEFPVQVRIDTPQELLYYRHGGILQYVLRQLLVPREGTTSRSNVTGGSQQLLGGGAVGDQDVNQPTLQGSTNGAQFAPASSDSHRSFHLA